MPLPMTVPTTTAAAWLVVRCRASLGRDALGGKTVAAVAICAGIERVWMVLGSLQEAYLCGQVLIQRAHAGDWQMACASP